MYPASFQPDSTQFDLAGLRRWLCCVVLAACLTAGSGCGVAGPSLGIDDLERGRISEQLVEIDLGEFSIPIPTSFATEQRRVNYRTLMLLRFRLWGLVSPRERAHAEWIVERNGGMLRDRVMTTCRRSPLGDLQDPHLTALRSRVLDEVQPMFEGHMLRRVFMTDVLSDPI